MVASVRTRRFTVDEFERMGQAGILTEDDRVELIEGKIVEMTPIGPAHAVCVTNLTYALMAALGQSAIVRVQNPIVIPEHNEPEPDVAVVRPRSDLYQNGHPRPEDIHFIVEVADSTLAYDRDEKVPVYARAGIPEVWLVDLEHRVVIVHRDVASSGYTTSRTHHRSDRIAPLAFPDQSIALVEVLG
jgi:Uma2 family endonuclease